MPLALVYDGPWVTFYTATPHAGEFLAALTEDQWRDFRTCARTVDRSMQIGRPSPRVGKLAGSDPALFELRVTPRGRKGAHVRLLYLLRGRRVLIMRGVLKRQPRITRRDVEHAQYDAEQYLQSECN